MEERSEALPEAPQNEVNEDQAAAGAEQHAGSNGVVDKAERVERIAKLFDGLAHDLMGAYGPMTTNIGRAKAGEAAAKVAKNLRDGAAAGSALGPFNRWVKGYINDGE